MRFLLKRLIYDCFLLLGVSLLSFLLLEFAPGDFFEEIRLNPQVSAENVAALRHHYAMDRSVPVRYARWLESLAHGDLGFSFSYNSSVGPLLAVRARNTLLLTTTAMIGAWLLAVPLGAWSAARPGGWLDRVSSAATCVFLSVPELLLALALLLMAVRTGFFPAGGMASSEFGDLSLLHKLRDLAWHLFLPVTILVLGIFPTILRHARAAISDVLGSPFIRSDRSHGISERRALFHHALPAAANPLISLFGLSVAALLSASLLVEIIMSWPGLGPLLLDAILARDVYVVIGAIMISTVFLVIGNFLADIVLYLCDPRIRAV